MDVHIGLGTKSKSYSKIYKEEWTLRRGVRPGKCPGDDGYGWLRAVRDELSQRVTVRLGSISGHILKLEFEARQ